MDILKAPAQKAVVKDAMSYHVQVLENAPYFFFFSRIFQPMRLPARGEMPIKDISPWFQGSKGRSGSDLGSVLPPTPRPTTTSSKCEGGYFTFGRGG